MKHHLVLAGTAVSIAAFTPVKSQQCSEVRDSVMRPVSRVITYLAMNPKLDSLSGPGCLYILQQLKRVPQGSDQLRQMAARRVENSRSRCLDPINSIRYRFSEPRRGEEPRFAAETYSYCGQWEYSLTNGTSYESSMELAYRLDRAYDKAQAMCGMAIRWNGEALQAAQELKNYLSEQIREATDRIYGESCGEGEAPAPTHLPPSAI